MVVAFYDISHAFLMLPQNVSHENNFYNSICDLEKTFLNTQTETLRESFCKIFTLNRFFTFLKQLSFICLLKFNNRISRKRCEICLKLTIKTPERRHWRRTGVFIVNFERISHLFLVFLLMLEQVNKLVGKFLQFYVILILPKLFYNVYD